MDDLSGQIATLLSILLIVMALVISAAQHLTTMVRFYRAQSWVLTVVVILTAAAGESAKVAVLAAALLPAALAVLVPPLLGRASLTPEEADGQSSQGEVESGPIRRLFAAPRRAGLTWLQHGQSRLPSGVTVAVDLFLVAAAVVLSSRLASGSGSPLDATATPSLIVAIALLFQGLFTMANKSDIISQIIGLLVIEHGLFVAAVRIAPPQLSHLFVLSLFFYVAVTLTILVWILPQLHRRSGSIEVCDNQSLNG